MLVEESTLQKLAPSVERILGLLSKDATHHDHLVALLIVLLEESGFHISTSSESSQCQMGPCLRIPETWKSKETGTYELTFHLSNLCDKNCRLIVVPLEDTLILNAFLLVPEKTVYSMSVQTLKYVNMFSDEISGVYMNLKSIAHSFKDRLVTPVRADILTALGMPSPSLSGLPVELKVRILKFLDAQSLLRMAQCSREFNKLCLKESLWKDLMERCFPYQLDLFLHAGDRRYPVKDYKLFYEISVSVRREVIKNHKCSRKCGRPCKIYRYFSVLDFYPKKKFGR